MMETYTKEEIELLIRSADNMKDHDFIEVEVITERDPQPLYIEDIQMLINIVPSCGMNKLIVKVYDDHFQMIPNPQELIGPSGQKPYMCPCKKKSCFRHWKRYSTYEHLLID